MGINENPFETPYEELLRTTINALAENRAGSRQAMIQLAPLLDKISSTEKDATTAKEIQQQAVRQAAEAVRELEVMRAQILRLHHRRTWQGKPFRKLLYMTAKNPLGYMNEFCHICCAAYPCQTALTAMEET